jgi:hypothetical protein
LQHIASKTTVLSKSSTLTRVIARSRIVHFTDMKWAGKYAFDQIESCQSNQPGGMRFGGIVALK